MPAEDVLAEALCRIEAKQDVIIRALKVPSVLLLPFDSPGQSCPVCKKSVEYQINVTKKVVVRKCGCRTGKVPPDMDLFNQPIGLAGAVSGNQEPEQQEAQDPSRRR